MGIKRIGFVSAKRWAAREQIEQAKRLVTRREGTFLAELRPASYCGPGSAGDRGAAILSTNGMIDAIIDRDGSYSR